MPQNLKQSFRDKIKKIAVTYGEVYDTEVENSIADYVNFTVIRQNPINPEADFQTYTNEANKRVRGVVNTFVKKLQKKTLGYTYVERKALIVLNVPDEYV